MHRYLPRATRSILCVAVAFLLSASAYSASGEEQKPGDPYKINAIEFFEKTERKRGSKKHTTTRYAPADGYRLVAAYPPASAAQVSEAAFKKYHKQAKKAWHARSSQNAIGGIKISPSLVRVRSQYYAWAGDQAMAPCGEIKDPDSGETGYVFVGPDNGKPVEVIRLSAYEGVASAAKLINRGQSFGYQEYWTSNFLKSYEATAPLVLNALAAIAEGKVSLVRPDFQEQANNEYLLSLRSERPEREVQQRTQCALGVWILSEDRDGAPLAGIMTQIQKGEIEGYQHESTGWDFVFFHTIGRNLDYGPVSDYLNARNLSSEEQLEAEANAIENIYKHLPQDKHIPFLVKPWVIDPRGGERWGLPLEFSFKRTRAKDRPKNIASDVDQKLVDRLIESEVKSLSVLISTMDLERVKNTIKYAHNRQYQPRRMNYAIDRLERAAAMVKDGKPTLGSRLFVNRTIAYVDEVNYWSNRTLPAQVEEVGGDDVGKRFAEAMTTLRAWNKKHPFTEAEEHYIDYRKHQ